MKTQKGQIESEIVKETNNGHIFLSVTPYDEYQDHVEYVVNKNNGKTVGRFETLMQATKAFKNEVN